MSRKDEDEDDECNEESVDEVASALDDESKPSIQELVSHTTYCDNCE